MIQELLYTSAPKGLKPGSRGFCTVLSSSGMSAPVATALEGLSGYRPIFPPGDSRAKQNPVVYSHLQFPLAGRRSSVLSRIADYGLDYSQRTNKLAHHVIIDPVERPAGGPAWLLLKPGFMRTSWDGELKIVSHEQPVPQGNAPAAICTAWQQATGDAGWAGVLAENFLRHPERPAYLLFEPGMDLLPLIAEALALLPPERRWEVTFSTYFTKLPQGGVCNWRCVLADSPEANESRRSVQSLRLNLCQPMPPPPPGPYTDYARTGRLTEIVAAVPTAPPLPTAARPPVLPEENNEPIRIKGGNWNPTHPPHGVPSIESRAKRPASKKGALTAAIICLLLIVSTATFLLWHKLVGNEKRIAAELALNTSEVAESQTHIPDSSSPPPPEQPHKPDSPQTPPSPPPPGPPDQQPGAETHPMSAMPVPTTPVTPPEEKRPPEGIAPQKPKTVDYLSHSLEKPLVPGTFNWHSQTLTFSEKANLGIWFSTVDSGTFQSDGTTLKRSDPYGGSVPILSIEIPQKQESRNDKIGMTVLSSISFADLDRVLISITDTDIQQTRSVFLHATPSVESASIGTESMFRAILPNKLPPSPEKWKLRLDRLTAEVGEKKCILHFSADAQQKWDGSGRFMTLKGTGSAKDVINTYLSAFDGIVNDSFKSSSDQQRINCTLKLQAIASSATSPESLEVTAKFEPDTSEIQKKLSDIVSEEVASIDIALTGKTPSTFLFSKQARLGSDFQSSVKKCLDELKYRSIELKKSSEEKAKLDVAAITAVIDRLEQLQTYSNVAGQLASDLKACACTSLLITQEAINGSGIVEYKPFFVYPLGGLNEEASK